MRTKLIIFALSLLAFVSCVPELVEDPQGIVLNLEVVDPQTRATQPGDEALNENLISGDVDIFFYDESTLKIKKKFLRAHPNNSGMVQIQTNPEEAYEIFGTYSSGAHCGLFVVANLPDTTFYAGKDSLTQIKRSLLPHPVWDRQISGTWESIQSSFIMTGQKQASLINAQGKTPVKETVQMSRIAAKVTFDLTVADNASGDAQWVPDTANMSVYMVYAMRKATLGADPVPVPVLATEVYRAPNDTTVLGQYHDKVLYNTGETRPRQRTSGESTVTVNAPIFSPDRDGAVKPFYSYPMSWETGSSMEPYMKLIIPWTYNNTTRKYYYKIPFHGNELLRNHWYHISIDVQILGTEQADPPVVSIHYAIADWGGKMDVSSAQDITSVTSVPAQVISARYLDIPTTEYVLFDEDSLTIPLRSSHDLTILGFDVNTSNAYKPAHIDDDANYIGANVRVYNPYLNTTTATVNAVRPNYKNDPPTPVPDNTGWTITINGRESISIHHEMNRNMSDANFDVAPYTLRFRVCHENAEDDFYSDVIIEQRPSIIIKPQHNSDTADTLKAGYQTVAGVYQNVGGGHTYEDGFVFINGVRTNTNMKNRRTNKNFNMYIVETSVLPTEGALSGYVLGDPRVSTPVSTVGSLTASRYYAAGVDIADTTSTRQMENYYPAAEDDDHKSFVAPSFRVASSFGTSNDMSRDSALLRCATYQEDGYPAGRWRLPTEAEVYYMITLSQKGKIPTLFSPDANVSAGGYWNANGAIFPLNGGSVETRTITQAQSIHNGRHWVRCVYDEWYWSDTVHEKAPNKEVWTWGDEAKNTVHKN